MFEFGHFSGGCQAGLRVLKEGGHMRHQPGLMDTRERVQADMQEEAIKGLRKPSRAARHEKGVNVIYLDCSPAT